MSVPAATGLAVPSTATVLTLTRENLHLAATPLRIVLIIALAFALRVALHRAVKRLVRQATSGTVPIVLRPLKERGSQQLEASPMTLSTRRHQRAETIGSVLGSIASFTVFGIAATMVLSELGLDLGPIVASAGIIGVAVGFGAQNLIKDVLNGMFMILEDQYGVGDVIDAGPATGTVESVGLRSTRLRDVEGTVWHIRNGEVIRIGNQSQGWARAVLDVPVAWETDLPRAIAVVKSVIDGVWRDPEWSAHVLEEPEVWGVQDMGSDGVLLRLVVKTAPLEQWRIGREVRLRLKTAFDAAGIEVGVPLSTVRPHAGQVGAETAPPVA